MKHDTKTTLHIVEECKHELKNLD